MEAIRVEPQKSLHPETYGEKTRADGDTEQLADEKIKYETNLISI